MNAVLYCEHRLRRLQNACASRHSTLSKFRRKIDVNAAQLTCYLQGVRRVYRLPKKVMESLMVCRFFFRDQGKLTSEC